MIYIKDWKEGEEITDLYYLLASIKLALRDGKVECGDGKDIGLIITHENPGLEQFMTKVIDSSFKITKAERDLTKGQFFAKLYFKF